MIKKGITTKYFQPLQNQQHNSARLVKLDKINNTISHKYKPESAFTSISSIGYNADKIKKKIHINDEIITKRKQNHLNTQYNRRLNALKVITKENKKIYQRINSQKSLYSQDDMRRSSVSIRSLSRSTSRVSNKSGRNSKIKNEVADRQKKGKIAVTIQPESVNNVKGDNIKQFKSVFMIESNERKRGEGSIGKRGEGSLGKREDRSFSVRQPKMGKGIGNMLHKIAEQMYVGAQRKYGNSKKRFAH